ncbi:MAG: transposase, partial [Candidatus Cloacimonadaceae bacterium]|nr:transposase [Candidatus Cloacimonadaceae bacterium]
VMPDHVHLLLSLHPKHSVSEMARVIKANSSRFINEQGLLMGKFHWGAGYGAFSCSYSQLDKVRAYIDNQKEHHRVRDFGEELSLLLSKHGMEDGAVLTDS